jgi:glycosyltransferase involved in cell wall biosynthesis
MRIYSICVVKNEDDIIEQTLKAALQWSDFIYVLDNGSCDRTWEKVIHLSQFHPQIIPYQQQDCTFHLGLRAQVFHHYKAQSQPGDWWCRLDADEIYIDDPRIFLAKIPQTYQAVWCASFQYFLTDLDLERYQVAPEEYADDVPVEQKCRYYLNNWAEARFVRYDDSLVWDLDQGWPYFGAIYPVRIWLKHYQWRSPQQIQKRLDNRLAARSNGYNGFIHEQDITLSNWQQKIQPASQLNYDVHDRQFVVREDLMPPVPSNPPAVVNSLRTFKKYTRQLPRLRPLSKAF